jgi:PAS domain S-box-containing protein
MNDRDRPRDELISEIKDLRQRVAELEGTRCLKHTAETALQESEDRLRVLAEKSEKRFRLAFEEGPLGMVIGDLEGRIVEANRALCQMLGYSAEELEGLPIDDLTHPDDCFLNRWFLQQLSKQQETRPSVEKRYVRKDGDIIWGRVTASLLPVFAGDTRHAFAMIEDITEFKTAQQAVEKEQRQLRRLMEMLEHERQLVAYEIHDGFVQSLVGARMLLDMPRKHLHSSMIERFEKAVDLLDRGIDEARQLISGQRPLILDERGLMAAIEHLVCERQIENGPEIVYENSVSFDRLAPPLETAVFRVVQEGLNNAERHSQSPRVQLRLTQLDNCLRVEIQDWGVGFDPNSIGQGCFGLEGLRERARIFGGTAEITTVSGVGTTVTVEFPLVVGRSQTER